MKHTENCQFVAKVLGAHGFKCREAYEQGVDFIVTAPDQKRFELRVRSRLFFYRDLCEEKPGIYLAFPYPWKNAEEVFLYHHLDMLNAAKALGKMTHTLSWRRGRYSWPAMPDWAHGLPPLRRFV